MSSAEGSAKVMLNNKRLSAMIDSLQKEDIESQLLKIGKQTAVEDCGQTDAIQSNPTDAVSSSPSKLSRSPAGFVSLPSPDKRASILSEYSGVLHEGIGISYVVQNQGRRDRDKEDHPTLPALPSVETLRINDSNAETVNSKARSDDLVIKTVPNAKPVERLNSTYSKNSNKSEATERNPAEILESNDSLRLLSMNKHHLAPSSVGSGNLASESGSSYYNHHRIEDKRDSIPKSENFSEMYGAKASSSPDETDNVSIVTSIIPPLSTTLRDDSEGINPVRSETTSFNPTVPPRSKNRPRSRLFIRDTLDDIESQLMEQMRDPVPLDKNTVTRSSTNTNHSDAYFSAASYQESEDNDINETVIGSRHFNDDKYLGRPLPKVPSPLRRDSTIRALGKQGEVPTSTEEAGLLENENDDDLYEDLDETENQKIEGLDIKSSPSVKSSASKKPKPKPSHKKRQTKKKRQELRSFDVDTLSQLLNVTKGTLIGSEFANLGMKIEEKRALEKLVDSLSRLTADMVLDPDRYEEGLRRLDKATKALEGF